MRFAEETGRTLIFSEKVFSPMTEINQCEIVILSQDHLRERTGNDLRDIFFDLTR